MFPDVSSFLEFFLVVIALTFLAIILRCWTKFRIFGGIFLLFGCASLRTPPVARTDEQLGQIKLLIQKKLSFQCRYAGKNIVSLNGAVKKISVINDGKNKALLYESTFRTGTRTLFQPLNNGFELEGDAYFLGDKNLTDVVDFNFVEDSLKQIWTSYRFKVAGSELYRGAVEYVDSDHGNSKPRTFFLPVPKKFSVHKIWVLPIPKKGGVQIIVRASNSSDRYGKTSKTSYLLFSLNTKNSYLKKLFETVASVDATLSDMEFFQVSDSLEPVAFGVKTISPNAKNLDSGKSGVGVDLGTSSSEIVMRRVFFPNSADISLLLSQDFISQFAVKALPSANGAFVFSWLSNIQGNSKPQLNVFQVSVNMTSEGIESNRDLAVRRVKALKGSKNYFSRVLEGTPTHFNMHLLPVLGENSKENIGIYWSQVSDEDFVVFRSEINFDSAKTTELNFVTYYGPEPGFSPMFVFPRDEDGSTVLLLSPLRAASQEQRSKSPLEICLVPNESLSQVKN